MRVALDTNVLAYAEGVNGAERRNVALTLIARLPPGATVVPAQVLGELFNVLVRKAGKPRADARNALSSGHDAFPVIETSLDGMWVATDLAVDHNLGVWDAVILSAASRSGCRLLCPRTFRKALLGRGAQWSIHFPQPHTRCCRPCCKTREACGAVPSCLSRGDGEPRGLSGSMMEDADHRARCARGNVMLKTASRHRTS